VNQFKKVKTYSKVTDCWCSAWGQRS